MKAKIQIPATSFVLFIVTILFTNYFLIEQTRFIFFATKLTGDLLPFAHWLLITVILLFIFKRRLFTPPLVIVLGLLTTLQLQSLSQELLLQREAEGWSLRYSFLPKNFNQSVSPWNLKATRERLNLLLQSLTWGSFGPLVKAQEGDAISWKLKVPRQISASKSIVFIHGGGWDSGSPDSYPGLLHGLALEGHHVYSVAYPLSSLQRFPAQRESLIQAIRVLGLTTPPVLVGRSAGGHLALDLCVHFPTEFEKCVILYAPTDLTFAFQTSKPEDILKPKQLIQKLMGVEPSQNQSFYQDASPLRRIPAELPPLLFLHGSQDIMVWQHHSTRFHEESLRRGHFSHLIVFPGFTHGFDLFPATVPGYAALKIIHHFTLALPQTLQVDKPLDF